MLYLHPTHVTLNTTPLPGVESIAVARKAKSVITDFTDDGPHPTFADVPERLTTLIIKRRVPEPDDAFASIALGDELDLAFRAARTPDAPHALRVSARTVITGVESSVASERECAQTITAVAVSTDGDEDPLTVEPVSTLPAGAN
ncbi:MAG: hypothetical protein NXI14_10310 [bacterium]|nr:hypothetical protein [bacterium]